MKPGPQIDLDQYSDVLADSLREVAADLRTVDLVDLAGYIRFGSYATIEDLMHSSTELYFRPGTLTFAWSAGVDLAWGEPPVITMAMEFRQAGVSVFFDLTLRALDEAVKIRAILFDAPMPLAASRISYLAEALAAARLPRRGRSPAGSLDLRREGEG